MKNYLLVAFAAFAAVVIPCHSATIPMEIPPDVIQFQNFLHNFEENKIHLAPTAMLFRGNFPLAFEEDPKRQKREAVEPTEPGLTMDVSEDDLIKQYVQNEINRIFSCYQRLRCGYTRGQAEQDCKWLESSSLYHQIMKVLGIKNYPKKFPAPTPAPVVANHGHGHVQRGQVSDAVINPAHQNLQNGIRYGGARPGQYLQSAYNSRNRRAYDSFFNGQQLAPLQGSSTT